MVQLLGGKISYLLLILAVVLAFVIQLSLAARPATSTRRVTTPIRRVGATTRTTARPRTTRASKPVGTPAVRAAGSTRTTATGAGARPAAASAPAPSSVRTSRPANSTSSSSSSRSSTTTSNNLTATVNRFSVNHTTVESLSTPSPLPSSLANVGPSNPGAQADSQSNQLPMIVGGAAVGAVVVGSCFFFFVRRRKIRPSAVAPEMTSRPAIGKPVLTKQPSLSAVHSREPSDATAQILVKPSPAHVRSTENAALLSSAGEMGVSERMSHMSETGNRESLLLYNSYPKEVAYDDALSPIDPDQQYSRNRPFSSFTVQERGSQIPDSSMYPLPSTREQENEIEPESDYLNEFIDAEPMNNRPQTDFYDYLDSAYNTPDVHEEIPPLPHDEDPNPPDSPLLISAKKLHQTMILPSETTAHMFPHGDGDVPPLPQLPPNLESTSHFTPPPLPLPPGYNGPSASAQSNYPVPRVHPAYNPSRSPTSTANEYGPPPIGGLPPAPQGSKFNFKPPPPPPEPENDNNESSRPETMAMVGRFGGPLAKGWGEDLR